MLTKHTLPPPLLSLLQLLLLLVAVATVVTLQVLPLHPLLQTPICRRTRARMVHQLRKKKNLF